MNSKKEKGLLKKSSKAIKKQAEVEKYKKERKKKVKKNKPRGYNARIFGAITFWVLFCFMFLVVLINILGNSDETSNENIQVDMSKITSLETIEYAKSFLYDMFNNENIEREQRLESLQKYLTSDVKIEDAISFGDKWFTSIERENIILKDISKTNEEKANFTFQTILEMKRELTDEEKAKMKKDEKSVVTESDDKETKEGIVSSFTNNHEIKEIELFIVVPVALIEGNLYIYDLPSYTYVDNNNENIEVDKYAGLQEINNSEVTENVKGFLDTFFQSFSQDSKDKLNYILEDERYENGLNKTLDYDLLSDIRVFEGKNDELIADANVTFVQSDTGMKVNTNYTLVIVQKDKRYIVKYVNNEKYIEEVLKKIDLENESEDVGEGTNKDDVNNVDEQDEEENEDNKEDESNESEDGSGEEVSRSQV